MADENHDTNSIVFSEQFQSKLATRLHNQMIDEPGDFTNNRSLINVLDSIVEAAASRDSSHDDFAPSFVASKSNQTTNNRDNNNNNEDQADELIERINNIELQLSQYRSRIIHLKSSLDVTTQLDTSKYTGIEYSKPLTLVTFHTIYNVVRMRVYLILLNIFNNV